jgi:hypothetical protein
MRPSVHHVRLSQPTLFHPPDAPPAFQTLPRDIQEKAMRLLARLLRLQAGQTLASGEAQEACHE